MLVRRLPRRPLPPPPPLLLLLLLTTHSAVRTAYHRRARTWKAGLMLSPPRGSYEVSECQQAGRFHGAANVDTLVLLAFPSARREMY